MTTIELRPNVYLAEAIKDYVVEGQDGDRQEVKKGKTYTIGYPGIDNTVLLFSSYWVRVPRSIFSDARPL